MRGNYHTHTYRCKHASGEVKDYAKAAVEAGLSILAITDHTPLPDNKWLNMRMDISELEHYCAAIDVAQACFPQLVLLKGMECEYSKAYHAFFAEELLQIRTFDFLSASAHYFPCHGGWESGWDRITGKDELAAYAEYLVTMIKTGLFDYVAHPDMFGSSYPSWDEEAAACSRYILEAAEACRVALEINSYGFRKGMARTRDGLRFMYPWEPFWELASRYDIPVTVNSDAHSPSDIVGKVEEASQIAARYGLKIIEFPHFCNRQRKKHK